MALSTRSALARLDRIQYPHRHRDDGFAVWFWDGQSPRRPCRPDGKAGDRRPHHLVGSACGQTASGISPGFTARSASNHANPSPLSTTSTGLTPSRGRILRRIRRILEPAPMPGTAVTLTRLKIAKPQQKEATLTGGLLWNNFFLLST